VSKRDRPPASPTGFAASPHIGQVVAGRYRIHRVLGESRGTVLLAHSAPNDVVVRLVPPHSVERPSFIAERVASAARAAAQLGSDHVARVLDVGEDVALGTYIVTEYLEGETLASVLARQHRLDLATIVDYVLQACDALAEAHAQGIVHAGIRTSNLFRSGAPGAATIKVLDFGLGAPLAGWLQDVRFESPEQLQGVRGIDHRTDIWALGVVLYELSTGHVPFEGASPAHLLMQILTERARPLQPQRFPEPVWAVEILQNVIERCLRQDPADRFPEVEQLAYALVPLAPTSQRYGRWVPREFRRVSMGGAQRDAVHSSGYRELHRAATDPLFSDSDDEDEERSSPLPSEPRLESAPRPLPGGGALRISLFITLVAVAASLLVFIDGRWGRSSAVHASALPLTVAENRSIPMLVASGRLDREHALANARSATTRLEQSVLAAGFRISLYREGQDYQIALGPFADLESVSQARSTIQAALAVSSPRAFSAQDLRLRCVGVLSQGRIEGVPTYDCAPRAP